MTPNPIKFPVNPFEDVKPSDFNKLNKKHVTEDFVEENFRNLNWEVYRPFNDTGVDRIITKGVCPNGHTKIDENLRAKNCHACNAPRIKITRFIQVKTRQLKKNIFGFTLKSKDIRIDPRHIYLLYSDKTTDQSQDFLIVSITDYLSFFNTAGLNPFASTSFRRGNNKLNSLKYNVSKDSWFWGKNCWDQFRNIEGLKKLQAPDVDLNLRKYVLITRQLADKLQREFSEGNSYSNEVARAISQDLQSKLKLYSTKDKVVSLRAKVQAYLEQKCDSDTLSSMHKYFDFIKTQDTLGGDDSDE